MNLSFIDGLSQSLNTSSSTQTVYKLLIQNNNTYGLSTLNITCLDEVSLLAVTCNVTPMNFDVWNMGDYRGGLYRSYSLPRLSANSYLYYISPKWANYSVDYWGSVISTDGTYPQRTFNYSNESFSNASHIRNLYLLSAGVGVYNVFQVITYGNSVISGAHITITRTIGGSEVIITEGTTDNAGTFAAYLSPNYQYVITVTAVGYSPQVITLTPVGGTYTITMATMSSYFNYTSDIEGVVYTKYPPSGTLLQDGTYNFSFELYSERSIIYNCSFNLYDYNGTSLVNVSGCNDTTPNQGGSIYQVFNTTGITKIIYGEYYITYWNSSGNTTSIYKIEGDARWRIIPSTSGNYWTSLKSALYDFTNLPEWGTNPQTTDFSRIVFFFIFFAIVLAALNFYTGYDTAYPGSFIYIMVGIVFLMTIFNGLAGPGFFYLAGATNRTFFGTFAGVMDNWILFFHFFLLLWIYFFTTQRRYQS
jgi:hypothetical protein